MELFAPSCKPIERNKFVSFYGQSYYLDNPRIIPGVGQNSRFVEDQIDALLRNGIKSSIDIVHILAWKIGKINHRESEKEKRIVYTKDWLDSEATMAPSRYGKHLDLKKIAEYISGNIGSLEETAKNEPQNVLNELKSLEINGLGTVYLITLLYFISRGVWPIYDRFAKVALDAIDGNLELGSVVEYKELPDKSSSKFGTVCEDELVPYRDKIYRIFGDDLTCRDYDRALWVYGHGFESK